MNNIKTNQLLFFVLCLIVISGCSSSEKTSQTEQADSAEKLSLIQVLGEFATASESSVMDGRNYEARAFFQSGWLESESNYLMIQPLSTIRFFVVKQSDRMVSITLKRADFPPGDGPLPIAVSVNGETIETIHPTRELKKFSLSIPGTSLQPGSNFIGLQTRDNLPGRTDPSGYLLLSDLEIETYPKGRKIYFISQGTKKIIIQPPLCWFDYYLDAKEGARLTYQFRLRGNLADPAAARNIQFIHFDQENTIRILEEVHPVPEQDIYQGTIIIPAMADHRAGLRVNYDGPGDADRIEWLTLDLEKNPAPSSPAPAPEFRKHSKPHIFLIILDAARSDRFGYTGYPGGFTPVIDSFAESAFIFRNFYAQAPYTTSSVATILTGLYTETHTVRTNQNELPAEVPTLHSQLKANGYKTSVGVGNIHLISNKLATAFDRVAQIKSFEGKQSSEMKLDRIKSLLDECDLSSPNFVYFHLLPPHGPYNPPAPFNRFHKDSIDYKTISPVRKRKSEINRYLIQDTAYINKLHVSYLNNLHYADFLVGEILNKLKELNAYENSIIIISSDHGEAFFEHGKVGHNHNNYDEMIQIPCLIKMPNQTQAVDVHEQYGLLDLMPTLLEIVGDRKPPFQAGISIAPLLHGDQFSSPTRLLYSRAESRSHNLAILYENFKYQYYYGKESLHNLVQDPDEKNDLSVDNPFFSNFLKQKVFFMKYKNEQKKLELGHRSITVKDIQKYKRELRSLGYLIN